MLDTHYNYRPEMKMFVDLQNLKLHDIFSIQFNNTFIFFNLNLVERNKILLLEDTRALLILPENCDPWVDLLLHILRKSDVILLNMITGRTISKGNCIDSLPEHLCHNSLLYARVIQDLNLLSNIQVLKNVNTRNQTLEKI